MTEKRCIKLFVDCDGILSCNAPFADDISKEKCFKAIEDCEFRKISNFTDTLEYLL